MNDWRVWGSRDQIPVLFCKKEFKGKANSRQESAKFIKAKHALQSRGTVAYSREKERDGQVAGYKPVSPGGRARVKVGLT